MAEQEVKEQITANESVETDIPAVVETKPAKRKKKAKRSVPVGQAHISASFNNTIVTFTDTKGNVLSASSAGANGFRGSKKGTAYAAQIASESAGQVAKSQFGMTKADIYVKGIGMGRDSAIRAISNLNIQIENVIDVTGVAHGGARPRKARRV